MPKQFERVRVREFGGPEKLEIESFVPNLPTELEVEVDVAYSGVNRADLLLREGKYHLKTLPVTPGLEASGTVAGDSRGFRKGDRVVIYKAQSGMYSQRVIVGEDDLLKLPDSIGLKEAASIPLNWLTAYDCLTRLLEIKAGQTLVIFAAASGVGQAAIQIARANGVKVFAVVSTPIKAKYLKAQYTVDTLASVDPDEIESWLRSSTGGKGVDAVFDLVGGGLFKTALKVATSGGRVAQAANPSLEDSLINVRDFYPRNISIHGFQYGNLAAIRKDQFSVQLREILEGFKNRIYRPLELNVFPLENVAVAHLRLGDRSNIGKILLQLGGQ